MIWHMTHRKLCTVSGKPSIILVVAYRGHCPQTGDLSALAGEGVLCYDFSIG